MYTLNMRDFEHRGSESSRGVLQTPVSSSTQATDVVEIDDESETGEWGDEKEEDFDD